MTVSRTNNRPTILPLHRRKEGLSAKVMKHQAVTVNRNRTHTERHHPPVPILIFHQISMSGAFNAAVHIVPMIQNGVMRAAFPRSVNRCAAENRFLMAVFCAAFRHHQVIHAIFFIKMRAFLKYPAASFADELNIAERFTGFGVDFTHIDSIIIPAAACSGKIAGSVIIPEQIRVNAIVLNPFRFRPLAADVIGINNEITMIGHVCCDHVKQPVMVPQGRRVDSSGSTATSELYMCLILKAVTNQLPIDQILTVKDRYARKKFKTGCDQIKVIPYPADRRIRMKPTNDWILINHTNASPQTFFN